MSNNNAQCSCGEVKFTVTGKPLLRAFCHCTICQKYNQAAYADITLFRAKDVIMPRPGSVKFSAYKKPPAAQRGKCVVCGKPALETLKLTMLDIVIIPSVNVQDKSFVSDPQLHIFYDTAVTAMDDNLPKYSGYLKSQLAFSYQLIKSLVRKA